MLVVGGLFRNGQVVLLRVDVEGRGNGLALRAGVVSPADGHSLSELVDDRDSPYSLDAELLGEAGIGEVKLVAGSTLESSHGLSETALVHRPLRLLVSGGTGVGAEFAGGAGGSWRAIGESLIAVLDPSPATELEILDGRGTVV